MRITKLLLLIALLILASTSLTRIATGSSWAQHNRHYQSDNLWSHIRNNFSMDDAEDNPKVQAQIRWIKKHPTYIYRLTTQAAPYLYYVYHQVQAKNIPAEVALLPMIESAYDPFAYSRAGAAGLWQLMPGTASGLGLKQDWWYDGRRDVYASTEAALKYLIYLNDFFDGNWMHTIAAYDSGEGTVQQAILKNRRLGRPTNYWELPLPHETQAYIPRLLALVAIIKHPWRYGIDLPHVLDEPYFAKVDVGHQVNLADVAKTAHIKQTELYKLNPGFNRWATDPAGPFNIVLPIDKVDHFKANLNKPNPQKSVTWQYYVVNKDDNLSTIANRYKTTVALLKTVNKLQKKYLKPGQELLIPATAHKLNQDIPEQRRRVITQKIARLGPHKYIHQVKSYDTMESIAKKYQVKAAALRFWNNKKNNKLTEGEKIVIWTKMSKRKIQSASILHYKVEKGDSLIKIAKRYHINVADLKKWNPEASTGVIKVGQHLAITLS